MYIHYLLKVWKNYELKKFIKSAKLHLFDQKYSKKQKNCLIFECSSAITLVFIFKNMLFKNISHFKKYIQIGNSYFKLQ